MPDNWKRLPWGQATKGEQVWLYGTHEGQFRAYGPHAIHDPDKRELASGTPQYKGRVFRHYSEDLLVPA